MTQADWSILATYSSGFEADLALAQLEAAGIPALLDSHDSTGIFGPGFQGSTLHGFTVRVPTVALDEAHEVVTLADDDSEPPLQSTPEPPDGLSPA